jgi:hypothetical protein
MATDLPQKTFLTQINGLLNLFVDYGTPEVQDPVAACSLHYLQPVQSTTEQDRLIEAAFKILALRICTTLFDIRKLLLGKERDGDTTEQEGIGSAVELIRELIKWLDWSDWKACGQCALDEVCFIAVFPMGTAEDHYCPHCINNTEIQRSVEDIETNYWMPRNIYPPDK